MPSKFTAQADSLILQMRPRGALLQDIAAALKHQLDISISCPQIYNRYRWLTMTPAQRDHRRHTINSRRREIQASKASAQSDAVHHTKACPIALAERDRRLALAPRSLSAALCGDPLPGYSALDRRACA